jgi:hypothetical protein
VRDLFQYIERYKPQEVELDTPLKCFIPEYIPAIGELDAFIKVIIILDPIGLYLIQYHVRSLVQMERMTGVA